MNIVGFSPIKERKFWPHAMNPLYGSVNVTLLVVENGLDLKMQRDDCL